MRVIALVLISMFICNVWAQDTTKYHLVKLYANADFKQSTYGLSTGAVLKDSFTFRELEEKRFSLSPALRIQTPSSIFHEFQLTYLSFDKIKSSVSTSQNGVIYPTGGTNTSTWISGFRYEIGKSIVLAGKERKLIADLGLAIAPTYVGSRNIPLTSNSFPNSQKQFSSAVSFVPHIKYQITEKFLLDLNMCLALVEFEFEQNKVENPAFSMDQQTTNHIDVSNFPRHNIARFGISYML